MNSCDQDPTRCLRRRTAIILAAAHERRQAAPYGRVDINKTVYDDHFFTVNHNPTARYSKTQNRYRFTQ